MPTPGSATPPAPGRAVRLVGAENVRDLGGLSTADGRALRRGLVLRGDLVARLLPEDAAVLVDELGLRTVVDLRTRSEVRHEPGTWLEHGVGWVHCPVRVGGFSVLPDAGEDHVPHYLAFLSARPEPVVLAMRTIMDPAARPVLFHCAAGKDRTGVLAALTLDVLGVPAETIAEDFALTGLAMERVLARLVQLEPYRRTLADATAEQHRPSAETMLGFLAALHQAHGGAAGWLREHGVPDAEIEAFRTAMLTRDADGVEAR